VNELKILLKNLFNDKEVKKKRKIVKKLKSYLTLGNKNLILKKKKKKFSN